MPSGRTTGATRIGTTERIPARCEGTSRVNPFSFPRNPWYALSARSSSRGFMTKSRAIQTAFTAIDLHTQTCPSPGTTAAVPRIHAACQSFPARRS
ncbi:MAG: hypothetical protein HMLKMBBP_00525 [Planctomycetes bacterium]|nr:hypothetical protein [Planctomycetota bacterium]